MDMRLWHEDLIQILPRQQLLGQHRECCALRGNGWGKPHSTVNYVFNYHWLRLYEYHRRIMNEMGRRGYKADDAWRNPTYRGKQCEKWDFNTTEELSFHLLSKKSIVYPEHNQTYLQECIDNLKNKGVW